MTIYSDDPNPNDIPDEAIKAIAHIKTEVPWATTTQITSQAVALLWDIMRTAPEGEDFECKVHWSRSDFSAPLAPPEPAAEPDIADDPPVPKKHWWQTYPQGWRW